MSDSEKRTGFFNWLGKSLNASVSSSDSFSLNIMTTGNGVGSVSRNPEAHGYAKGQVVSLTATAQAGSKFVRWTDDATGSHFVCNVRMDSAKSICAQFARDDSVANKNPHPRGAVFGIPGTEEETPQAAGNLPTMIKKSGSTFPAISETKLQQIETNRSTHVVTSAIQSDSISNEIGAKSAGSLVKRAVAWGPFIDNDDGTATDALTGLMWLRTATGQSWSGYICIGQPRRFSLNQARAISSGNAGYFNWRLPTTDEITSLIAHDTDGDFHNLVFPNQAGEGCYFWSDSGQKINPSLKNGTANTHPSDEDLGSFVRLVRTAWMLSMETTLEGSGTGVITRSPRADSYPYGSDVTLTARADAVSVFQGWRGDAIGLSNVYTVKMDSAKTVSAKFEQLKYFHLVVQSKGKGIGIITRNPKEDNYVQGSTVKLTARPVKGSKFMGWNGDVAERGATCTITMDATKTISAEFSELEAFALAISTTGSGTGKIVRSLDAESYIDGTEITLTASANDGSKFKCWFGDATGRSAIFTVTMDTAKSITAEFVQLESYALDVTSIGNGTGLITRSVAADSYFRGSVVTLRAQAAEGSTFNGWSGDATELDDICTVKMNSAKSVAAEFERVTIPDLGIAIEFEAAKDASMKGGEAAFIFHLSIRNSGEKQVRVQLPPANFVNRLGEEIEQSVWLSGLVVGTEGATIRAGTFRKMGLVFYKTRLNDISKGDRLYLTVNLAKPSRCLTFTLKCTDSKTRAFALINAVSEDRQESNEISEAASALANIHQRIELLEKALASVLGALENIAGRLPQSTGNATSKVMPTQTLPEVLAWLCTQARAPMTDLQLKLRPLDLMPSAVIDDINERAYDLTGEAALDDSGDAVTVQRAVLLQVLAAWDK